MSDHTEEEQIALIKDWWKRNGTPLITGGALALALVFGWQAWQKHQVGQAQQASVLYQELMQATLSGQPVDVKQVTSLVSELRDKANGSHYQQYAELILAKLAVDENRLEEAAETLRNVAAKPADKSLEELAKQRLARVLMAQDKASEALEVLSGSAPSAFVSMREEIKGDIYVSMQKPEEARKAYQAAREALPNSAAEGALLMKLDDLSTVAPREDA